MTIGEICTRNTVITTRDSTVAAAAQLMRRHHVGTLVVVDSTNGGKHMPVGIVTDRDAVIEVMATGLDFSELAKIMAREQTRETTTRN
jgi:predicted transcriptional regulator